MKYGYCAMVSDFFHIGHLKLLLKCKEQCDKLIVGIMTDECVERYKGKRPIMSFQDRKKVVENISFVYRTCPQDTFEFPHHILTQKVLLEDNFIIFDNEKHNRKGADVLIPYMEGISSTLFKETYLL